MLFTDDARIGGAVTQILSRERTILPSRRLRNREELLSVYCTFTALRCKSLIINGAGEGNRTLVSALGRPHSTIEPHPQMSVRPLTERILPGNCFSARSARVLPDGILPPIRQ